MLSWVFAALPYVRRILPMVLPAVLAAGVASYLLSKHYRAQLSIIKLEHQTAIETSRRQAADVALAAAEQARQIEQVKIKALEKERESYVDALATARAALDDSRRQSGRLRDAIAAERRKAAALAVASGRDPASAATPWLVLEECRREYATLAADADELNNRLRLAIGYARAVIAE